MTRGTSAPTLGAAAPARRLPPGDSLPARLAGGALWSALGSGLSRAMTLAAMVVVARVLGPGGFGRLGIVQSTAGLVGVYAGLGLGLTATKYLASYRRDDPERAGRLVALVERAALFGGAAGALTLVLTAPQLATRVAHAPSLAGPLASGAALVLFGALNGAQTGALAGLEAFRALARVNALSALGSLTLPLIGVWLRGLEGAVVGMAGALAAGCLLAGLTLRAELGRAGIRVAREGWWRERSVLWRFALPAVLGSSLVVPATWLGDLILIGRHPDGYAELGVFNAADQWRVALLFLPGVLAPVLVSVFSSLRLTGHPRRRRLVLAVTAATGAAAALPGLLVILAGSRIMGLYGPEYRGREPVLALLVLAAVVAALAGALGQVIVSSLSMWWNLGLNGLWAAGFVGCSVVLVPRLGALGLAAALLIAYLAQFAGNGAYVAWGLRGRAARPLVVEGA
ncbi:MAG TPA: oligosaccharide flippase family protein [Thermomicrobiaceae bacterium]|nr:oligosaccharide flippase family protein [Thermomicrobiaceae bacterium]